MDSQESGNASGARRNQETVTMYATISRPLSPSPVELVEEVPSNGSAGKWGVLEQRKSFVLRDATADLCSASG